MNIKISNISTVAHGYIPSGMTISHISGLQEALDSKQETGNYISTLSSPLVDHSLFYTATGWITRPIQSGDVINALGYTPGSGNGGDINLPIAISDVTNLQSSLNAKAASTHVHAISDVTSLQASLEGKAALSHTHSMSDITDLSLSGVASNYNGIYNVYDYGVSVGGDSLINSKSFQEAVDEACLSSFMTGNSNGNGSKVYIPGTASGTIDLHWPVWINGHSIMINGEGDRSTVLKSLGPAFMISFHPKYWTVLHPSFSDVYSASGTISNGSPTITSVPYVERFRVGASVSGTNIPAGTTVLSKNVGANTITMSQNATGTGDREIFASGNVTANSYSFTGFTNSGSATVTGIPLGEASGLFKFLSVTGSNINPSTIYDVDRESGIVKLSANAIGTGSTSFTATGGWFEPSLYWEDMNNFMLGGYDPKGLFPPLNGTAPLSFEVAPGSWKALRTRGNIAQVRFPYHTLCNGELPLNGSNIAKIWPMHKQITWQFLVYHHDAYLKGGIGGAGGAGAPDPWFLSGGAGEGDVPSYLFDLSLTDKGLLDRTAIRLRFPQNATKGLHRIAIQYDRDSQSFTTWVDRTQVANSVMGLANHVSGYVWMEEDLSDLWTRYDRVCRWYNNDFLVGGAYSSLGRGPSIVSPDRESDYSVLAISAHNSLKYQVRTNGDAQLKIDSSPADDSTVWGGSQVYASDCIGWIACSSSSSGTTDVDTAFNTYSFSGSLHKIWGFLCVRGTGDVGTAGAIADPSISHLAIQKLEGGQYVSSAIYTGPYLYFNMSNVRISGSFFASIGGGETITSYDAHYKNLDVESMVHIVNQLVYIDNIKLPYPRYSAMRTSGAQVSLTHFVVPEPIASSEGFWTDFCFGINAGIYIEQGMVNWEDFNVNPALYHIYTQKRGDHGNNKLFMKDVICGTFAVPCIILDDIIPNANFRGEVRIENVGYGGISPLVKARGYNWNGEIQATKDAGFDTVVEYMPNHPRWYPPTGFPEIPNVKTVHKELFGPTYPGGGYTSKCHEIIVKKPAEGGVSKWTCSNPDPTGTYYEGTSNPPTWIPSEMAGSSSQHALSANCFNTIYCEATIEWPSGNFMPLRLSAPHHNFSYDILNHLMTSGTPRNRGYFHVGWDYGLGHVAYGESPVGNWSFFNTSSPLKVQNYFGSTVSGYRENISGITVTASNDPDYLPPSGDTTLVRRSAGFAIQVGDTGEKALFMGKTNVIDNEFWSIGVSQSVTIPSGAIKFKTANRDSGWTLDGATRIINFMLDGGSNPTTSPSVANFPSGFYIGLSTTDVTISGTNVTEPGGNYARVYVPRSSGAWQEIEDSKYMYGNKSSITFPTPNSDWGLFKYMFFADDPTSGNVLFRSKLNRTARVLNGDEAPTFKVNAIQIQL